MRSQSKLNLRYDYTMSKTLRAKFGASRQRLANNIADTLDRYVKSQSLSILRKCLENAIFMKIKYRHDIIQFLTYVSQENVPIDNMTFGQRDALRRIIYKINKIIEGNPSNYEELIENVYDEELGDDIRFNYSMYIILPYVEKLLGTKKVENLRVELQADLRSAANKVRSRSLDIDSLNDIFKEHTGRDYSYFQERYDRVVGDPHVTRIFNKWKAPKFRIVKIRRSRILRREASILRPDPRTEKPDTAKPYDPRSKDTAKPYTKIAGDDRLQEMHRNVVQSADKTLQSDKEKIRRIEDSASRQISNDTGAQTFWEYNMFAYIRKHNKHPRTEDRNMLIVVTCWIYGISHGYANLKIEDVIKTANQIGYETGSVTYAMGLYNEMFTRANASVYKKSFMENFSSYPIPIEKIKVYLERAITPESIANIIETLHSYSPPKTKKEREDMVYDILKPIKSLKITRKHIQELLNS